MQRKAHLTGLAPILGIGAVFGLAPSFGHCQPPSLQPDGTALKSRQTVIVRESGAAESATPMPLNVPRAAVIPVIAGAMSPLAGGTAAVLGAPYSGIRTTTLLNGDKIVLRHTTRFFRDSHGRTRLELAFPANSNMKSRPVVMSVTINDPVSGQMYTLIPQQKTAVVSALPITLIPVQPPVTPPTPAGLPRPGLPGVQPYSESKPVALGKKVIDGITVVGTRVEDTITFANRKPNTITVEQWFSPELGIAILTTHRSSDGAGSTERLEHIVRAEPAAALFGIPPDYTRPGAPTSSSPRDSISSTAHVEPTKNP
jgi:hypothetical protein